MHFFLSTLTGVLFSSLSIQFFRDVAWERDILSLRVKCKKSEAGCDWIEQLRHYEVYVINLSCLNIGCF